MKLRRIFSTTMIREGIKMGTKNYDPACYELAEHFLKDVPPDEHSSARGGFTAHENACHDLAMTIQKAVEDWFGPTDPH
jgi:hypothetical protein